MADERKFKFISPGVFIDEIDNSQLPATPGTIGPVVIGAAPQGPGMVPVTVNSFSELVETFGEPNAGQPSDDAWRNGQLNAPSYGLYAAQAWLRNNAPLTFVRLLGEEDPDANTAGKAGWKAGTLSATPSAGGAFALVAFPSSSVVGVLSTNVNKNVGVSGAVAAMFYCNEGRVVLSGNLAGPDAIGSRLGTGSNCTLIETDEKGRFHLAFAPNGTDALSDYTVHVSLNPDDNNFIRKVLNTNPTVVNTTVTTQQTRNSNQGGAYWLGESFERQLLAVGSASMGVTNGSIYGTRHHVLMLPMRNQETITEDQNDHQYSSKKASTGWYIAQDLNEGTNANFQAHLQQKLFRFEARTGGQSTQRQIKVSIENIRAPEGEFETYGSFSVVIRNIKDTDVNQRILERYDSLNLNPASPNYIATVIGDKFVEYDTTTKTNREYGNFDNKSRYIRVAMNEDVDRGTTNSKYLPFGVFGPLTYRAVNIVSGSGGFQAYGSGSAAMSQSRGNIATMIDGGSDDLFGDPGGYNRSSFPGSHAQQNIFVVANGLLAVDSTPGFTGSIVFPSTPLRRHSNWGQAGLPLKNVYFGAWTGILHNDQTFDPGVLDTLTARASGLETEIAPLGPKDVAPNFTILEQSTGQQLNAKHNLPMMGHNIKSSGSSDPLQHAWVFTLDDIMEHSASLGLGGGYVHVSGTRQHGASISALSGGYTGSLNRGLDRFTTLLHGGFDGTDITERDPFRNSATSAGTAETDSSKLHSLKRAVNIVSDTDQVQFNVVTMPGITQQDATGYLLEKTEERGDALAIIDLEKIYTADTENTQSASDRNSFTIKQATDALKARNINNSYGAAYAPWVQIQDTISNRIIWVPPSVVALGSLSSNDRVAAPWFAPAGFTRGGLSEGAGGIPVLDVSKRLSSDDRDDLYEAGINPIAKFPAEGIVIFGQKTLQQTRSALDRINVRRLLIFLKREISFIASRLLFAQNNQDTWNRFLQQATPVLESVKSQFGIDDFRLVLDSSTTTPDLVDRNIIYSKLIVKPTRSAEFFAIDFVITNSGASFED
jgi:phage tail sheath protein FI